MRFDLIIAAIVSIFFGYELGQVTQDKPIVKECVEQKKEDTQLEKTVDKAIRNCVFKEGWTDFECVRFVYSGRYPQQTPNPTPMPKPSYTPRYKYLDEDE